MNASIHLSLPECRHNVTAASHSSHSAFLDRMDGNFNRKPKQAPHMAFVGSFATAKGKLKYNDFKVIR